MKWNRKWEIPHTVLERRFLCFSSYKNHKLKVKLWWVRAHERKKRIFCTVILSEGNIFKIYVLSQYIVHWIHFQNIYFFTYQKYYFIHFCCLFLKLSKASNASLIKKSRSRKILSLCFSWNILLIFLHKFFLKQDRHLNKTLQSRHAQFSRFHFFIGILKGSTYLVKFFQILDPMNEILFDPLCTVLNGVLWTGSYFSRWSVAHSFVQNYSIYFTSVAGIWKFPVWIETEPSFSNSPSNGDCFWGYIISKQCLCTTLTPAEQGWLV